MFAFLINAHTHTLIEQRQHSAVHLLFLSLCNRELKVDLGEERRRGRVCRRAGEQLKVGGGGWKGTVNDEERDTGIQLVDEQCKRHTEVRVKHEQAHKI